MKFTLFIICFSLLTSQRSVCGENNEDALITEVAIETTASAISVSFLAKSLREASKLKAGSAEYKAEIERINKSLSEVLKPEPKAEVVSLFHGTGKVSKFEIQTTEKVMMLINKGLTPEQLAEIILNRGTEKANITLINSLVDKGLLTAKEASIYLPRPVQLQTMSQILDKGKKLGRLIELETALAENMMKLNAKRPISYLSGTVGALATLALLYSSSELLVGQDEKSTLVDTKSLPRLSTVKRSADPTKSEGEEDICLPAPNEAQKSK